MSSLRVALLSLCTATACAPKEVPPSDVKPASSSGLAGNTADMQEMADQMAKSMAAMRLAQDTARTRCEPLRTRLITPDEEVAVGRTLGESVQRTLGPPLEGNEPLKAWVQKVGRSVASRSSRPELPWAFVVVESEKKAVRGAPGGTVYVSTAMLKEFSNEAQLAVALGHEVAHVSGPEALDSYRRVSATQCQASVMADAMLTSQAMTTPEMRGVASFARDFARENLMEGSGSFVKFLFEAVLQADGLGHPERDVEFAADATAARLAAGAGYDVKEFETFLSANTDDSHAHPAAAERVEKLSSLRASEPKVFGRAKLKPAIADKLKALAK